MNSKRNSNFSVHKKRFFWNTVITDSFAYCLQLLCAITADVREGNRENGRRKPNINCPVSC